MGSPPPHVHFRVAQRYPDVACDALAKLAGNGWQGLEVAVTDVDRGDLGRHAREVVKGDLRLAGRKASCQEGGEGKALRGIERGGVRAQVSQGAFRQVLVDSGKTGESVQV